MPLILPAQQSQIQLKKKNTQSLMNINFNLVILSSKFASLQPKEIVSKLRNNADSLIQKKKNKKSQSVSNLASVFINKEDLPIENALVKEPNNRREVKLMLKKLNLNIE